MIKIYVCLQKDIYEQWLIKRVFSTKDLADRWINDNPSSRYYEEHPVDAN